MRTFSIRYSPNDGIQSIALLHPPHAERRVRGVAPPEGLDDDLGRQGKPGMLNSRATQAACLAARPHRLVCHDPLPAS